MCIAVPCPWSFLAYVTLILTFIIIMIIIIKIIITVELFLSGTCRNYQDVPAPGNRDARGTFVGSTLFGEYWGGRKQLKSWSMEGRMDGHSVRRTSRVEASIGISPADWQAVWFCTGLGSSRPAISRSATRHGDSSIIHDGRQRDRGRHTPPPQRSFFQPPATTCIPGRPGYQPRGICVHALSMAVFHQQSLQQQQQQQLCLRIHLWIALHRQQFSIFVKLKLYYFDLYKFTTDRGKRKCTLTYTQQAYICEHLTICFSHFCFELQNVMLRKRTKNKSRGNDRLAFA